MYNIIGEHIPIIISSHMIISRALRGIYIYIYIILLQSDPLIVLTSMWDIVINKYNTNSIVSITITIFILL